MAKRAKYPSVVLLPLSADVCREKFYTNTALIDTHWVPARPEGFASWRERFKCAWLVFTGRADALVWPKGQ